MAREWHIVPDILGNRSPLADPQMSGAIVGIAPRETVEQLVSFYVVISGGLARSLVIRRILADASDTPIARASSPEPVLLGAAIAASVACVALLFSGPRGGQGDVPGEPLAASTNATQQPALMAAPRPGEFRAPLISPALDVHPASVSSQVFASPSAPIDPRLQSYLIRHYDAAAGNGQSAMLPYVLLVVPPPQPNAGDAGEGTVERR